MSRGAYQYIFYVNCHVAQKVEAIGKYFIAVPFPPTHIVKNKKWECTRTKQQLVSLISCTCLQAYFVWCIFSIIITCRPPSDTWSWTDHLQINLMHLPTPPKCSTRAIMALINNLGIVYHQYCSSSYLVIRTDTCLIYRSWQWTDSFFKQWFLRSLW